LMLEVTRLVDSDDRDVYRLVTMVQLMAESPKTHLMSHAWYAYATPTGRDIATKMGLPIDTNFTPSDLRYIDDNKQSNIFMPSDPETIRPYVLIFIKRLTEKDFNAFSWAYFYLEVTKDMILAKHRKFIHGNTRSTTGKPDILLWRAMAKILPVETYNILVNANYNHTENRPFLQNAILIALYGLSYHTLDLEPFVQKWHQLETIDIHGVKQPVVQQMLNGDFTLEIDPFVIDKHTHMGRIMGMGTKEFHQEGAKIIPQNPTYYNQTLDTIYTNR